MSIQAKFWQTVRSIRKVGKLRGVISIPEFEVPSGNKSCLHLEPTGFVDLGNEWIPTTEFTIQFWLKVAVPDIADDPTIIDAGSVIVRIQAGKLLLYVETDDFYPLLSIADIVPDVWVKVSYTFKNHVAYLYLDGILDNSTSDMGTGNIVASTNTSLGISASTPNPSLDCYISNLELWTSAQSAQHILEYQTKLPYSGSGMGLKYLVSFREYDNLVGETRNWVTGTLYSIRDGDVGLQFVNDYPYDLYNCNFIVGEYPIDTGGKNFSVKYPLTKPVDANFVLCVSRPSDDARFYFWTDAKFNPSVDILPYTGQKLEDGSKFEIWSLADREVSSNTSAIEVQTSLLHIVSSATDVTRTVDATVLIDTNLVSNYPLALPIIFDQEPEYPGAI